MYGCERPEIKKDMKGKIEPPMKLLHNIYTVDIFPCSIFLAIWFLRMILFLYLDASFLQKNTITKI